MIVFDHFCSVFLRIPGTVPYEGSTVRYSSMSVPYLTSTSCPLKFPVPYRIPPPVGLQYATFPYHTSTACRYRGTEKNGTVHRAISGTNSGNLSSAALDR